jgi:late competence protein required for DNA uptake (superfamily II DNA/RNA helicase)
MISYEQAKKYLSVRGDAQDILAFDVFKYCSVCIGNPDEEVKGRDIVIRCLEVQNIFSPSETQILNSLIEAYGLYPYLINTDNKVKDIALDEHLRLEYNKSLYLNDIYLHSEQRAISELINSDKNVILSAPTSFGKSLLIEEIVASGKFKQIVIIQPTLALLDETRKKLSKYADRYKILVSTSQSPDAEKGNLFLFTAERVVEYTHFDKVDFFIIDEFYKLSLKRNDERAFTLNLAFYKLLELSKRYYLLGPMINSVSSNTISKLDCEWYMTGFQTVAVNNQQIQKDKRENRKEVYHLLFEKLDSLTEPTLIYCSSVPQTFKIASEFLEYKKSKQSELNVSDSIINLNEWIQESISNDWILKDLLRNKVAVHNAVLPRHLGSSIVDLFNNGEIKYIFCTPTIIEGVNTSAKNVVIYSRKKGMAPLDFFDFMNISGRAGRMRRYYVGNVYHVDKMPENELFEVDIPIISQIDAPIEILIGIKPKELTKDSRNKLSKFNGLPAEFREIIKKNSGISVDGQIALLEKLKSMNEDQLSLLKWSGIRNINYGNLEPVLTISWENLGGESRVVRNAPQLTVHLVRYLYARSLRRYIDECIASDKNFRKEKFNENETIANALDIYRHWFQYKLPKWLSTVSNIQKYYFSSIDQDYGDYEPMAAYIENNFLSPLINSLAEYDIPMTALQKLSNNLNGFQNSDEALNFLKSRSIEWLAGKRLLKYEIDKIKQIK